MACRFTYNGKTYDQDGLAKVLRDMPPSVASKYIPGVKHVADAPFVSDPNKWAELSMKRILRYASENGYAKIAWTPGEVQAARYDLSKHIDRIGYTNRGDGTYNISAEKDGKSILSEERIKPDRIADLVGKDMAEKITNGEGKHYDTYNGQTTHELTGLDLKVGGEGKKKIYDEILPQIANKLGKKHGARVEKASFPEKWQGPEYGIFHGDELIREIKTKAEMQEAREGGYNIKKMPVKMHQAHTLDITPSLRKSAMEQGFSQFARGGAVKVSKVSVNYSKGMPKSHCGICEFYRTRTCTKVQGSIDPAMWCRLFKKKRRASGGPVGDDYTTVLSPAETDDFAGWKHRYAPNDSGVDYDLQGAYHAGVAPYPVTGHFVDTFKKPNHPTFSNQSQYAKDRPDLAGTWEGETYIPPRRGFAEGGGPQLQRTAGFPEKPEGYEFYSDAPEGDSVSGVGAAPPENDILAQEGVFPGVTSGVGKVIEGVGDWIATPRKQMEGPEQVQPEVPGQWSEEDEYRQNLANAEHAQKETKFGAETPMNMLGMSVLRPGAFLRGSVGVAGGKLPPVPPMEKVHNISGVPQAEAEAVMQANAGKGLTPLPSAADEMRLKLERAQKLKPGQDPIGSPQERIVVRPPKAKEGEPQLPPFVAGKVTPEDWVARHEQILSKDEITEAAKWYDKIFNQFLTQTKGDVDKAKQYMRGWLVAQQNVDVSGAMGNVLLQAEQLNRGVPLNKMKAAGMPNPTQAARAVMGNEPIKGGVGQKIFDFVDSAEGKDVRSWMANHPAGGKPFVVDVHTGRDTGLVDDKLINHLKRLGYNADDLKKLKIDLKGSPTQAQYEGRADFGRDLTDYLNKNKWQGKLDWTPAEVQAVGWMGMTKLTANKAEDVVSGLSQNMRNLSMELSPGEGSPWATKYGDRFYGLQPEDQFALTHGITQKAIDHASRMAGIDVRDIVHGTGGWGGGNNAPNPSTVAQAFATKQGAEIAANVLGHALQQTEVWANKIKPMTANPKGFSIDFVAKGNHNLGTDEGLRDLWSKIIEADPLKGTNKALFQGFQPIVTRYGETGIRVLIDRGGVKTQKTIEDALSGPVSKMVESLPYELTADLTEAEITKAVNDWKVKKDGQAYVSRLKELLGRDPTTDLGSVRKELETEFRKGLEAAEEKRRKTSARKVGGAVGKPRLVPVAHNPFEAHNAIRRAIHGY